ncbi:MAG: hypothetical protein E7645_00125 [Ruminococcaceae bacterium]|nr:hypothetical protein [Oscillospiraceae bacterium]
MKKIGKLSGLLALLLLTVLMIAACGKWEDPYLVLDEQGYSISVRYDVGDGVFANTNDVSVVDVYALNDMKTNANGEKFTYLLQPDDPARAQNAFAASYSGHFLAGWYQERTPRVNENGEALDAYGELCSVSGEPQGYTYAKPWDFSKPLVVDSNAEHHAKENYLTLYAAWIPYYHFEFYAVDAVTGEAELLETIQSMSLELPQWNESTGKLDMKKYPKVDNKTLDGVYLDPALTQTVESTLEGAYDPATATLTVSTLKVYTTWLEGDWFHIYTPDQLYSNSRLGGNYILYADLDFTGKTWSPTLAKGVFTGKIIGNGHKISNVSVEQANTSDYYGGLFGTLSESAELIDVTFENVTYKIGAGSRMPGVAFGVLAGVVADGANLTGVSVSGTLIVGADCYPGEYMVGLICGQGTATGVSHENVTALSEKDTTVLEIHEESGSVTVTFGS